MSAGELQTALDWRQFDDSPLQTIAYDWPKCALTLRWSSGNFAAAEALQTESFETADKSLGPLAATTQTRSFVRHPNTLHAKTLLNIY